MAHHIDTGQLFDECNERLDTMLNHLTLIARDQGAQSLGGIDLQRMRNVLSVQVNDFMIYYLAATAICRLVNTKLTGENDVPIG